MFWMRVGSSNSVELLLLDGRLLPDNSKKTNQLQNLLTFFTIKSVEQAKSQHTVHLQIMQGLNNKY